MLLALAGCGGSTEPAETAEPASTAQTTMAGQDVTQEVDAYIAGELEAASLADACTNQDITWACNIDTITLDGNTLTVTLTEQGEATLQAVAMSFRNFLGDGAPVTPDRVVATDSVDVAEVTR